MGTWLDVIQLILYLLLMSGTPYYMEKGLSKAGVGDRKRKFLAPEGVQPYLLPVLFIISLLFMHLTQGHMLFTFGACVTSALFFYRLFLMIFVRPFAGELYRKLLP